MKTERIQPATIGPKNAEAVLGHSWRWTRDTARRLGVPIWRVGGKPLIPAGPLLAALHRDAEANNPPEPANEAEAMMAQLGLRRVGAK